MKPLTRVKRLALWAVPVGALVVLASPASQPALAQQASGLVLAQTGGVEVPASGTVQAIATHSKPEGPKPRYFDRPLLTSDPAAFQKAKAAASNRAAATHPGGSLAPTTARTPKVAGPNTSGLFDPNSSPSDSTGDIGPNNYVEMVNSQIGVYDRGLILRAQQSLAAFGGVHSTDCAFDPQIAWDQQAGRWLYAMDDQVPVTNSCNQIQTNYLAFGWSTTSNPLGSWCGYALNTGSNFNDYPKLGHDNNFISIGANVFAGNTFSGAILWAVPKPAAGSTTCPFVSATFFSPLTNTDTTPAVTPVPADTTDSSSKGYVVSPHGGSKLTVWHLSASAGRPILSRDADVTVAAFQVPPEVPQPSTGATSCTTSGNCLDSLDGRLTQAVAHFDPKVGVEVVWTQHAITDTAVGTLSVERWYELIPGNAAPYQWGNISDPSLYIFNGAVSPAAAGNEAVIFYDAGNNAAGGFVSYRAQRRNSLTPIGTMANEVVLATSTVSDADYTCGATRIPATGAPCRWGDYSAARPDPTTTNAVWGAGMVVGNGGSSSSSGWTTQIASMTPGCTDASVSSPSSAQEGDLIQFTASSVGCSDPQYEFWLLYPNGTWVLKRTFSRSNTWTWDSLGAPYGFMGSSYTVHVWATQTGDSQAGWDSFGSLFFGLFPPDPCQTAFVSIANGGGPMGGVPVGTTLNLSASVGPNYCSTPVFAYWVQDTNGKWTLGRSFSVDPTWNWNTTGLVPGNYNIHVWAKQRGDSPASGFEAVGAATQTLWGCTSASISPPTATLPAGSTINLTGSSRGPCPIPQYEFWVQLLQGTWVLKQPWGASAFAWDTTGLGPGKYTVHVWVRQQGSLSPSWEAYGTSTITLTACTSAALMPANPSAAAGAVVSLMASSGGCLSPQYEFWVQYLDGSWHMKQSFGTNAFNWDTSGLAPGKYLVHVWANNTGDPQTAWEAYGSDTVTLTGCTSAALSADHTSPQPAGTNVTFTASSSGCTATPVYEFWLQYPNGTWVMKQLFSVGTTWLWNTTSLPKGTYNVHVWANNQGADTSTYETFGTATFTLT